MFVPPVPKRQKNKKASSGNVPFFFMVTEFFFIYLVFTQLDFFLLMPAMKVRPISRRLMMDWFRS